MKTNELMRANWVKTRNGYDKVKEIYENSIFTEDGEFEGEEFKEGEFEPIPLTEEILKKNGFKTEKSDTIYISGIYYWVDKGKRNFTIVTITFYKDLSSGVRLLTKIGNDSKHEDGVNNIHSCDIEYVHQLQQALRLCRIDKEIVL